MMNVFFDPDETEVEKSVKRLSIGSEAKALKLLEKVLNRMTLDGK